MVASVLYICHMTPGQRVEAARRRMNWSQEQLGKAIGSDQTTIARIENGRQSGAKHLPGIADKLGVPLAWLTVGAEAPAWAQTQRFGEEPQAYESRQDTLDRIALAVERMAEAVDVLTRQMAEKQDRDARRARERADLRKVVDQLRRDVQRSQDRPSAEGA